MLTISPFKNLYSKTFLDLNCLFVNRFQNFAVHFRTKGILNNDKIIFARRCSIAWWHAWNRLLKDVARGVAACAHLKIHSPHNAKIPFLTAWHIYFFTDRNPVAYIGSLFGGGNGPIVLSDLSCKGTEDSVDTCPNFQWGKVGPSCDHSQDASVNCSGDNFACSLSSTLLVGSGKTGILSTHTTQNLFSIKMLKSYKLIHGRLIVRDILHNQSFTDMITFKQDISGHFLTEGAFTNP